MKFVLENLKSGVFYSISKDLQNFGSNAAADVIIEELPPLAFQLRRENEKLFLTDLCGQGLTCNGKNSIKSPLTHGDIIALGAWQARVQQAESIALKNKAKNWDTKTLEELFGALVNLIQNKNPETVVLDLLRFACEVMEASHGLVRLAEREEYFPREGFKVSRQGIRLALEKGETLLWNEGDDSQIDTSRSIAKNQLTSLLVYPFGEQWFYLQRQAGEESFTEKDRSLFQKIGDFLQAILTNSLIQERQSEEIARLKEVHRRGEFIYSDAKMIAIAELGERVAKQNLPLLIRGETGTGKERFARFIHEQSQRAEGVFKAINCGAIPANLIESVLFGHKKGSFTGATEDRLGIFEQASGGTVFLDEIGELDLQLQVRLLRVLQEKQVTRLGDSEERAVDVRIVSATHVNLEEAIRQGRFREDLYFRLNVVQLELPALRERRGDIVLLAEEFIKRYSLEFNRAEPELSKAAQKALLQYAWPGNVRELQNKVQKALVLCGDRMEAEDLELGAEAENKSVFSLKEARERAEEQTIRRALKEAQGNVSMAARMLDVDRKVLRDHMERLHIEKEDYKRKE